MNKILVVEDEAAIREVIVLNLRMANYEVVEAGSAEQALSLFDDSFTLVLMDIMLPMMNGFSLCEHIRKDNAHIGIIMLSAKAMDADKVYGLSIGADDYMTKPFNVSELLARVEALVRRVARVTSEPAVAQVATVSDILSSDAFTLDRKSRVLCKDGIAIDLTQVEFQIMELFLQNIGIALPREQILHEVWGEGYVGDLKIVDVNIRRLRMKIEDEPSAPKSILTVWGYGYRWGTGA